MKLALFFVLATLSQVSGIAQAETTTPAAVEGITASQLKFRETVQRSIQYSSYHHSMIG